MTFVGFYLGVYIYGALHACAQGIQCPTCVWTRYKVPCMHMGMWEYAMNMHSGYAHYQLWVSNPMLIVLRFPY